VKVTLFTEELRKCLNAAGLSDCGENDSWNYWYQRVLKAHNDAVERQIATEQSENAKLRELAARAWLLFIEHGAVHPSELPEVDAVRDELRELGIDADGVTIARLRSDRTAPRVIVADGDTDCATGHCECGGCGGAIDCWDRFCKHCGARMEDAQ